MTAKQINWTGGIINFGFFLLSALFVFTAINLRQHSVNPEVLHVANVLFWFSLALVSLTGLIGIWFVKGRSFGYPWMLWVARLAYILWAIWAGALLYKDVFVKVSLTSFLFDSAFFAIPIGIMLFVLTKAKGERP